MSLTGLDTCGGDDGQAYIGRRMLKIAGKGKRGTPKRRFADVVGEDMQVVGVTEKDTEDRNRWTQMARVQDPLRTVKTYTFYMVPYKILKK